ncbi:MAG: helix-turn-helix transcriptional regulator [Sphingosinicella sp.]|nr:helix-turn-helix transcriptional regulator [Sphingosinicella sp.]
MLPVSAHQKPASTRSVFDIGLPINRETGRRDEGSRRSAVHRSKLGLVEDISISPTGLPPKGYETNYQVVLPYFGLFAYGVGGKTWLLDANRILFVSPGREYTDVHPVENLGHAAIVINPSREVLDEICEGPVSERGLAFQEASRPTSASLQLMRHQLLRLGAECDDPLMKDEWTVRVLREAMAIPQRAARVRTGAVDRAKEVLHARGCERLSLDDIAQDVGVTPVYLTQEFSRCEGIPLYRYQLRLRLNRALLELAYCDNITGLALDLGFSSHSHFSSVFRSAFGMTPSEYRTSAITSAQRQEMAERMETRASNVKKAA